VRGGVRRENPGTLGRNRYRRSTRELALDLGADFVHQQGSGGS
jgi:hypothetical protein